MAVEIQFQRGNKANPVGQLYLVDDGEEPAVVWRFPVFRVKDGSVFLGSGSKGFIVDGVRVSARAKEKDLEEIPIAAANEAALLARAVVEVKKLAAPGGK